MIQVGQAGAIALVGAAALVAVGWGAFLSVRSAVRGPAWALDHLTGAGRWMLVGLVVGGAVTVLVRPPWAGLAVTYVVGVVWWLTSMLRRNLIRVEAAGGFGEVSPTRRAQILRRARRLLGMGAGALVAIAVLTGDLTGVTAVFALGLAGVLTVAAVGLRIPDDPDA